MLFGRAANRANKVEVNIMKRRLIFILLILVLIGLSASAATAQNSYSLWSVRYWSNPDLEGSPSASASTGVISYDWGSGSPASGIPSDHWSGQWTSYVDFEPGTYRITTVSDDGVRVFLGDKHVIYNWNKQPPTTTEVAVSLLGGTYSMAVDYFEDVGGAQLHLGWERIGPPQQGAADVTVIATQAPPSAPTPTASWAASYWNNTTFAGNPVLSRSESAINYDWGTGSPAAGVVNPDFFSSRWTRSIYFDTATYRFTTQSDDGIRVSISGNMIIDNWTPHAVQTNSVDIALGAGTYPVVVEHYENAHDAVAKFWWENITSGGSGGGDPTDVTATVKAGYLNMRSGPGIEHSIIDVLKGGTTMPVVGRTTSGRWIQVVHDSVTGWVSAPYTTISGDLTSVPVTG